MRPALRHLALLLMLVLGGGVGPVGVTHAVASYDEDEPSRVVATTHDVALVASTPTTPALTSHTAAQFARLSVRAVSWSSTSAFAPRRAAKGADDALRTVAALTREQDAALTSAMRDPNKLRHIFGKAQHNLGPITQELGGREALMREAVLAVPRGTTGTFEITKQIGRYGLTVRGRVVNGVSRIGTVFVP